jgi:hypothetical protein
MPPRDLAKRAYSLYEEFRPEVPAGVDGWGAKPKRAQDDAGMKNNICGRSKVGLPCDLAKTTQMLPNVNDFI